MLSAVEARVLGALMEKEITTPEYYPLSLNALVNACNQKSNREPVMELAEADVRGALFALEEMGLARTLAEARVSKFEHRVRDGLGGAPLRRDEVAVLTLLLLRGPQTAAELRARAERLYSFDDNAAAVSTLERLAARADATGATPMTVLLPRQPGAREARWMHLLCGPVSEALLAASQPSAHSSPYASPAASASAGTDANGAASARVAQLEAEVAALQERVAQLEAAFATLQHALGLES
jgi:uncharacterized protein YceH (UPF0502 family)